MSPLLAIRNPIALDLPPGFTLEALRESGDAFAHACRIAAEKGAGTLVWTRRFDVAECAVVLEPEEPLASARRAFFLGMNALADAIAAFAPPEKPIEFVYPDQIRFDGGLVGGARLGWPKKAAEDVAPDWLVFAFAVRVSFAGLTEPGRAPDAVALEEEGFDAVGPATLIEAFARCLMREVDGYLSGGFRAAERAYVERLTTERPGDRRALDADLSLITTRAVGGAGERRAFLPALKAAAWLDRDTGLPRL